MDRFSLILPCFLFVADLTSALDHSLVTGSEVRLVSGVLMLIGPSGSYIFNFTDAAEACRFKDVTIATMAQLQQALNRGLETCKYGWISEQIAVVPRLTSVSTCGSGKTGLVTWNAAPHQKFGVWCFNASDAEETVKTTTIFPHISISSFKPQLQTQRATAFMTVLSATTQSKPLTNPTTIPQITLRTEHVTSTLAFLSQTRPKPTTSAPPLQTVSTRASPSSPTLLVHSSSTVGLTSTDGFLNSSEQSGSSRPARPIALSTALTVLCVVLILSAGGAVFYSKLRLGFLLSLSPQRSIWSEAQQKDDMETEMWKQTSREEEEKEEEEEEEELNYSSEVILCVNPFKVD